MVVRTESSGKDNCECWWKSGGQALKISGSSVSKTRDAPDFCVALGAMEFASGTHEFDFGISRGSDSVVHVGVASPDLELDQTFCRKEARDRVWYFFGCGYVNAMRNGWDDIVSKEADGTKLPKLHTSDKVRLHLNMDEGELRFSLFRPEEGGWSQLPGKLSGIKGPVVAACCLQDRAVVTLSEGAKVTERLITVDSLRRMKVDRYQHVTSRLNLDFNSGKGGGEEVPPKSSKRSAASASMRPMSLSTTTIPIMDPVYIMPVPVQRGGYARASVSKLQENLQRRLTSDIMIGPSFSYYGGGGGTGGAVKTGDPRGTVKAVEFGESGWLSPERTRQQGGSQPLGGEDALRSPGGRGLLMTTGLRCQTSEKKRRSWEGSEATAAMEERMQGKVQIAESILLHLRTRDQAENHQQHQQHQGWREANNLPRDPPWQPKITVKTSRDRIRILSQQAAAQQRTIADSFRPGRTLSQTSVDSQLARSLRKRNGSIYREMKTLRFGKEEQKGEEERMLSVSLNDLRKENYKE
ncbi:hypothetical protein GUITHDRAFT_164933, partial [Guillardia theta CCMP2712]